MALKKNDIDKSELNRQRKLDRSIIFASKNMQNDFHIYGYQPEDYIIRNGEKSYIAIFSVKCNDDNNVNLNNLNKILCANLAQRFRISVFYQKVNDVLKEIVYLSVFFEEDYYYLVHDQLSILKNELSGLAAYNYIIESLSLDSVFSYWNFNMHNTFENINALSVLSSKTPFEKPQINMKERVIFKYKDMYYTSLKLIASSDTNKSFPFEIFNKFQRIYFATDTWNISKEDFMTYNKILRSSFYPSKDNKDVDFVNFSAAIVFMDNDKEILHKKLNDLYVVCQERGFIFVPCYSNEFDYYLSLSSFGIMDYCNMRIMKNNQIINFY